VPTNVVTLLVTDLVESTARRVRVGEDEFGRFLTEHDRLVAERVTAHHGEVAKHTGDGMIAAFGAASDAVAAAVAIQQGVEQWNRHAVDPFAVRIGMSAGDVSVEDGDHFGTPMVEATRLCAAAAGGQIVAADVVRILAGSRGGHRFVALGALELKGLPPLPAVEVEWEPLAGRVAARAIDPRSVPIVGRSADVAELEAELTRARAGTCAAVLVLGEPGVGKSRLANELLDRHRDDVIALAARAYPLAATASLALWSEAIERHLRTLEPDEVLAKCGPYAESLATLLPSVAKSRGSPVDGTPPPGRLLAGLCALIENLSAEATVVFSLDDVHLADGSSWEALNQIVRSLATSPVLIVMTARPIELADHQVATEVAYGLEQDGLLHRGTICPLGPADLRALAGEWFGPELVGDALVEWLGDRSRGVTLFAVGLLRALADEEADLEHPQLRSLPEDLTERVHARLERLDPAGRALLELQAVVGSRLELDDVVALSGQPLERTAETLEALVRLRLVDEDERGRDLSYELAHPLIQDAIYERIGRARRRALHRHVARVLVGKGSYGAAAGHFVRSSEVGDPEAVDALNAALRLAEGGEHHHEALRLLDALLTLLPATDPRWLDVLDAMAWQADWVVDHRTDEDTEIAVQAMRNIAQLVERLPDPTRRGTVKFHLGSFVAWGGDGLATGRAMVEEARDLFESAGETHRALLARNELGYFTAIAGDEDGHEQVAREVLAAAEAIGDRFVELQALCSLVFAVQWSGRVREADGIIERALALARADGKWYRASYLLGQRAFGSTAAGDPGAAAEGFAAGKAANPTYRDTLLPDHEIASAWLGGRLGEVASASCALLEHSGGVMSPRRFGSAFGAMAAAERSDRETAELLAGVLERTYGDRDFWNHSHLSNWARAVVACGQRPEDSLAWLRVTLDRMQHSQQGLFARFVAFDVAERALELGDPAAARAAAATRALRVDSPALAALDDVADGAVSLLEGDADRAAEIFEAAQARMAAASWPWFEARTAVMRARACTRTDRTVAVDALQLAIERFRHCGADARVIAAEAMLDGLGPRGKRARTAVSGPDALSRREREVAALAVEGLSAKQIGSRLYIGERTVETHLAHVYAKVGVRSRLELVRRAAELGL
jgi:class 3 adenylate cyclase/DNA-binding CsgD family transcriptional regulator